MSGSFVLDCSVAVAWCLQDEGCVYSQNVLDRLENSGALVPFLWDLEVMNTIFIAEKRKRITAAEICSFLEILDAADINHSSFSPSKHELLAASRAYDLTSYDALYLMLAMHERIPLATKDKDLMRACDKAGVELVR